MLNRALITSGTRLLGSRFVASAASTRSLVHLLTKEKRPPSHKRAERGGYGSNPPFAIRLLQWDIKRFGPHFSSL